jgi:hypothetical protein
LLRKAELDDAEHIARAGRLIDVHVPHVDGTPVDRFRIYIPAAVLHAQALAGENGSAGSQVRLQLVLLDRVGHAPERVENHLLHQIGEDWCLRVHLAGDDTLAMDHPAVLDDAYRELGDVDPDVVVAEVLGHPAPLLHVGQDAPGAALLDGIQRLTRRRIDDAVGLLQAMPCLELRDRRGQGVVVEVLVLERRRDAKTLAHQRNMPMACAGLELGPIRYPGRADHHSR